MNEKSLLRLPAVLARTGLTRSVLYRLIAAQQFPSAVHPTERTSAWPAAEIDNWVDERIRESRERAA